MPWKRGHRPKSPSPTLFFCRGGWWVFSIRLYIVWVSAYNLDTKIQSRNSRGPVLVMVDFWLPEWVELFQRLWALLFKKNTRERLMMIFVVWKVTWRIRCQAATMQIFVHQGVISDKDMLEFDLAWWPTSKGKGTQTPLHVNRDCSAIMCHTTRTTLTFILAGKHRSEIEPFIDKVYNHFLNSANWIHRHY